MLLIYKLLLEYQIIIIRFKVNKNQSILKTYNLLFYKHIIINIDKICQFFI